MVDSEYSMDVYKSVKIGIGHWNGKEKSRNVKICS